MSIQENRSDKGRASKAAKSTKTRRVQRNDGQIADWASAKATLVVGAVAAVGRAGGALRFGYTSDGGAYAIGVYGDGQPYTDYVRPNEDIDAYLSALIESWLDV
jgi:hypothetical protein